MKGFVDSREPDKVKELAAKSTDISFDTKELPQGDFYLPDYDVIVERKEASDFASSITDGRLSEQADRMVANHDYAFVVIEGSPYGLKYSDIHENSLIGMQTSLAVKRGIHILYTEGFEQTVEAVNRVFQRFLDEEHEASDIGYVKTADVETDDTGVAMLAQIEGISEEKAREIDELFVFEEFVRHPDEMKEELQDMIDGVGPTLAERVINAFN